MHVTEEGQMEPITVTYLCAFVLGTSLIILLRSYIRRHMLGTFKYDNSGETYRCRFELDNIDDLENVRFAIVKVKEENLGLPGERKSQSQRPL